MFHPGFFNQKPRQDKILCGKHCLLNSPDITRTSPISVSTKLWCNVNNISDNNDGSVEKTGNMLRKHVEKTCKTPAQPSNFSSVFYL